MSPAAQHRTENINAPLPANVQLGNVNRDLVNAGQPDVQASDQQREGQPQAWDGGTSPLPVPQAAATHNNGDPQRSNRSNANDNRPDHDTPPWEDDEAFEDLDFPVQERARRAYGIRIRHHIGALVAGAAVGIAHGRQAGRQAHEQVLAHGATARAEADARVGQFWPNLSRRAAAKAADFGERWRESQRFAELEHEAARLRMAGQQVVVDPAGFIRPMNSTPAQPAPLTRTVREATREPRSIADLPRDERSPIRPHAVRKQGRIRRDEVRQGIIHLLQEDGSDVIYQLPRFGTPNSPRREEYIAEPEPGQRRAPRDQADEAQPEPQRAAQRDQADEAQPQHTQTDTRHGNTGRFYEPSYEWLEKATERYEQFHPLGMPELVSAEDRMQWIRNTALFAEHEAELNVHRLPKYLNPTLPLGPEAPETVAARKREQQLGGELDALYEEGTVEVPIRNRVGPNDSTRRRIQGIFELARGRGIVYSPNDENVLLRLFTAHANDENWSEADTMTILAKLAARQQRQQ